MGKNCQNKKCWFCVSGVCCYLGKCTGELKWSNVLNSFVPLTYEEREDLRWK